MTNEEAADALKRLIYPTHAPYHNEVIRLAIAALRTPPATGAAEMREAARAILADLLFQLKHGASSHAALVERVEMGIAALDLPLPAPEVPEEIQAMCYVVDQPDGSDLEAAIVQDFREWAKRVYGI